MGSIEYHGTERRGTDRRSGWTPEPRYPWVREIIAVLGVIAAVGGSWYQLKSDLALQKHLVAQQTETIQRLERTIEQMSEHIYQMQRQLDQQSGRSGYPIPKPAPAGFLMPEKPQ